MRKSLQILALVLGLAGATVSPSLGAGFAIKLATLVPERSVWGTPLKDMGESWKQATDGRVTMRLYPDGIAGDDSDMVRKMRIGQLHAATLSVAGLTDIDPAFTVFQIPMFYDSYEELFFVIEQLELLLVKKLEDKGYVFVHWGHAGWIHLFSSVPIRTLDDLRARKLFVWAGNDDRVTWWKANGFRPVPLSATDVMTGMQTGMFDAMPATPLASLSLQWFRGLPHMLDLGFSPLIGATVITKRAWGRISEEDRQTLLSLGEEAGEKLSRQIPEHEALALTEMEKRGLTITRVAGTEDEAGWHEGSDMFAENMRESFVPVDVFEQAVAARAEYRRRADSE